MHTQSTSVVDEVAITVVQQAQDAHLLYGQILLPLLEIFQ
jgi:hypothetical protein